MAATTAGAVKSYVEGLGLGVMAYRDEAPPGSALPYVTIAEAVAVVPKPSSPRFDAGSQKYVAETVQIDVWQSWRDATTRAVAESYTLAAAIARALDGAQLPAAPTQVSGVRLINTVRLLEPPEAPEVVHHAITVEIDRIL